VQALGVLFLRDLAEKECAKASDNRLRFLATKLAKSGLAPLELLLTMIFISARYTRPDVPTSKPFDVCASLWPASLLSDDERRRTVVLVDRAAPNRAIPMINALADACPQRADADAFRLWCTERLLAHLPLKPPIPLQPEIRVVSDAVTLNAAAEAALRLHGNSTATWFCDEIISKLNLWPALEPLLRARDYSNWDRAVENVLLAMSFGLSLARAAPDRKCQEDFQIATASRIADVLSKLGPELWHHFGDFAGRLVDVVVFLGACMDLPGSSCVSQIESIVENEDIPSLWRLYLILLSPTLARKYAAQTRVMAVKPTTPTACRDLKGIEGWVDRILAAAKLLENGHADLHENLALVRQGITQWRDGFHPQ
jgi:hypothetical protein